MKPMNTSSIRNVPSLTACFAAALCLPLFLAYNAGAAVAIQWWDNNGTSVATSGTWDTGTANWASSSTLTASTADFANGNVPAFAAGTASIASLTITVPGNVTCAGISNASTGAPIEGALTFNGPGPITLASGADGIYCGTNGSANLIFNTPINGAGQLVQHGSGALSLYGTNTYAGGTELTGGQVIYFNNYGSFSTNTILVGGNSGAIVNADALSQVVISNAWSFPTANYNINLAFNGPGYPGTVFAGAFSLPSSGNILLNTSGSGSAGGVDEITGVISGGSGLITGDYGILQLAAINTYSGNTAINSPATLEIVGAGSLGGATANYAGNITNNSAFIYNSSAAQTLSGVISGSGTVAMSGAGNLTLTGVNTYTGGTSVSNGTLIVSGVIPGSVTVVGGTLDAQTANSLVGTYFTVTGGTVELDNASAISNQYAIVTLPASGNNNMYLNFSGVCSVLSLNFGGVPAANGTWGAVGSGATHTSSAFTGTGILSVAVSGATTYYWDANGSDAADAHNDLGGGNGNWDNSTADWWVSGGADTVWQPGYTADFGGTAGTVTVAATVDPGSLVFTTPGYLVTNSPSSMILVTNPATLVSIPAGTTTIGSPIVGEGLVVSGPGTLVLSGTNTYAAGTVLTNKATVSVNAIADSGTSGIGYGPVTLANGTVSYTGTANATTTRQFPEIAGTTNGINLPAGNLTLNSQVNGNGGFVFNKTGSGTLTLGGTADNSYLGMNILAGEVICDKTIAGHALGGPINVSSGAELQLSGNGYGSEIYSGSTTPVTIYSGGQLDMNAQNNTLYTLALSGTGIGGVGAVINSAVNTTSVLTGPITLLGNTTLGGPGNLTFGPEASAPMSGNYALTWAGNAANLLTLSDTNTFYGGLIINPGTTVQLGTAAGAGDGPITMGANSTLLVNIAGGTLLNPIIGGPTTSVDPVIVNTNATLSLSCSLSRFTGTLNIPAETGNPNTSEVQIFQTSSTQINPGATINVTNGGTFAVVNHDNIIPCPVNLWGSGDSLYGSLRIEAGGIISGPVYLHGNTTMGNNQSGATVLATISGPISSVGGNYGITFMNEPGTIVLSGTNTYTGTTTLNGCILQLDSPENPGTGGPLGNPATPAGSIVMNGGELQFTSLNNNDYSSRFSTAANQKYFFDVNGQTVTLGTALTSSGGVLGVQSTTPGGVLVLSVPNTYTGPTTNASGTIRLAAAETAGTSGPLGDSPAVASRFASGGIAGGILMAGGTLQYTPANNGDYSGRFVTNASQSFILDVNGQNVTYSNALISPSGSLTLSSTAAGGSLTLDGTNAYSGATTINPGAILNISGAGDLGNVNGSGLYNAAINDQGTLNYGSSTNQLLPGTITGNGSLIVSGTGTLTLNATNLYYGGTTISNGTVVLFTNLWPMYVTNIITGVSTNIVTNIITGYASIVGNVTLAGGSLVLSNNAALAPNATLTLTNSPAAGTVNLAFSGIQNISALVFGTNNMPPGTYGAVGNAGATYQTNAFTGTGILNVAAQVAYWDPSPSLMASPGSGGNGAWDNSTSDWYVNGSADTAWAGTNTAYFAGTAGTVSVNANVSASGLLFAVSNYIVGGSSTLTLLDSASNGTPVITIPNGDTTINCPMASSTTSNSVVVNGPGTLNLNADNEGITNNLTITGGATVSAGTIADPGNGVSALGVGTNLTLLNGNLTFTGTGALGSPGQSVSQRTITLTGTISNTITVPVGDYLELDGQIHQVSESAPQGLVFTGGGTLVMGGTLDNSGLDLAINSGTVIINKASASNAHGLGGGTSTIASGGTLQLSGSGGSDLYSGCILTVYSGGTLDLNGEIETNSSTLTLSGAGSGGLGALINSSYGPALFTNSSIVLASNTVIGGNGSILLSAVISGIGPNGGAGPSLTYIGGVGSSGNTQLILDGANTFSGNLIVGPGSTVTLNTGNAGGTGTIMLESGGAGGPGSGGTLDLPGSGVTYGSSYENPLSGDSTTTINVIGTGTGNQSLVYGLTNFTGTINCGNGGTSNPQVLCTSVFDEDYPINPNATWNIMNGTTLDFQAPCTLDPANVIINGIGNNIYGSLRLDAATQQGNVLLNGNNCQIGDGNTPVGASTISGVISDGGNGYGFTKVGAAGNIIILTAVNTYSGPTVVSNGVLALAGSGSIATSSGLTLMGGTTFDVTGVTGGSYALGSSQGLNCYGTATVAGNLNLSSGPPLALQCTNIGTGLIVTNGTLTLNNNPITVTVYNSLGAQISPTTGNYPLISTTASITGAGPGFVAGSIAGSSLNVVGLNPAFNASLTLSNNTVYLIIAASAPTIVGQLPASAGGPATLLYAGGNPNFSVQAAGLAPLQYLWYTNSVQVGYANSSSLTLTNVQVGPLSTYCIVSNSPSYTPALSLTWTALVTNDPTPPYPALVVASQPLGYWRLDETEQGGGDDGVIAEDYLGNNDGVYTNVILLTSGYSTATDPSEGSVYIGALAFHDCDAYAIPNINFASPSGTSPTFSIEAWVNGYPQTQDAGIVSLGYGGGGEEFDLDTGNDAVSHGFRFFVRDASGNTHASSSAITPTYGNWHHLVGICDESNGVISLYVDGVIASGGSGSIAPRSGILSSTRNMLIGARPSSSSTASGNNLQFVGDIDEVAVYNYAMSATQVVAHYVSAGVPPSFSQVPPATINADAGQSLALPATALGTPPLLYVWTDTGAGTNLSSGLTNGNIISASQAIGSVPSSWNGDTLSLTVSNAYGETNITVSLNVAAYLQASLIPDTNLSLVAGESYTYTVAASGSVPITYQWSANGMPVTGATNDTFTGVAVLGNTTYSCLVNNSAGSTNLSVTLTGLPYLTLNGNGVGWSANQSGTFSSSPFNNNGALILTDGGGSEARSVFFSTPQYIGAFSASFTYQAAKGSSAVPADGVGFILQNDPRGAAALGTGGGAFGLGSTGAITPSIETCLNLYTSAAGGSGFQVAFNGVIGTNHLIGTNQNTAVLLTNNPPNCDPIAVTADYDGTTLSLTFSDAIANTFYATNVNVGNLVTALNTNFAFVGFSGGTGSDDSVQTISDFSFLSLMTLEGQSSGTNLILSWPNDVSLYQLQSASNLINPDWVNVNSPVIVNGNMNQVTLPATGAQAFYRLVLQ